MGGKYIWIIPIKYIIDLNLKYLKHKKYINIPKDEMHVNSYAWYFNNILSKFLLCPKLHMCYSSHDIVLNFKNICVQIKVLISNTYVNLLVIELAPIELCTLRCMEMDTFVNMFHFLKLWHWPTPLCSNWFALVPYKVFEWKL